MKKPVIAVDVDDVLMPTTTHFIKHLNRKLGTNHEDDSNPEYFYDTSYGISRELVDKELLEFGESEEHAGVRPIDGAIAALQKLQEKYEIDVITARGNHWRKTTEEWLNKTFPATFRNVNFIFDPSNDEVWVPKSEICKKVGAKILIDDAYHNIEESAAAGIRGILFGDYIHNRDKKLPDNVTRAKDWDEVLRILM